MMIKNTLRIVKKNLRMRKKDLCVTTFLLILSLMAFILGITFSRGMNQFVENNLEQIPKNKTLFFHSSKDEYSLVSDYIKNELHEIVILDSGEMLFGKVGTLKSAEWLDNQIDISTQFYNPAYDNYLVEGSGITKSDTGKIVLPLYFNSTKDSIQLSTLFVDHSKLDSGLNYLGANFSVSFQDYNNENFVKDFEVVGVYDNSQTQNQVNEALISYGDLKKITEIIQKGDNQTLNSYYFLVNSNRDKNTVTAAIRTAINRPIDIKKIVHFDPVKEFVLVATLLSYIVSILLLVITLVYISIITFRNVSTRKREIGLLYSIGYSYKQIKQIFLFENVWIALVGYPISFILYSIITAYVNYKLAHQGVIDIVNLQFECQWEICSVSLLVGMGLIIYITHLQLKKINQIDITEIMKEKNDG